jgi:MFS family permease
MSALTQRLSALPRRTFRSLRVRNYRLYFFGQLISLTGAWMQSTAQGWLVYKITGSPVQLGFTVALQFTPMLLFGAWGGVLADRFDKRRVLIATQTAATLQAVVLGALAVAGVVQVWEVWLCALTLGLINVLDNPSRQAFVVEMVGRDDLINAVGLNAVTINGSRIVGPALAGLIIALAGDPNFKTGTGSVFLINAASFLFVIAALVAMRQDELLRSEPVRRAAGQIRAGLSYAWHARELRIPLVMMAVVSTLAYNFQVIVPLMTRDEFHRGAGTNGMLFSAMGVGALAGSLVVATRRRPTYRLLVAATVAFGVFSLLGSAANTVTLEVAAMVLMGGAGIAFVSTTNSLLQVHSIDTMRGRVMSLWAIVFLGSTPIGATITGLGSAAFGPRVALGGGGVATLAAGLAAFAVMRRLRDDGVVLGGALQVTAADEVADEADAAVEQIAEQTAECTRP